MSKQNELNISLQGERKSIFITCQLILPFIKALSFFYLLLENSKRLRNYFSELTKVMSERQEGTGKSFKRYQTVLDLLVKGYNERFSDFEKYEITLKLAFQLHPLEFSEALKVFHFKWS